MESKDILIGLAAILVLAGLAFGVAHFVQRDEEPAKNESNTEQTQKGNTTEQTQPESERNTDERKFRILPIDTVLTRLNADLDELEEKIDSEKEGLEIKIANLYVENAEAKASIGDLKATYDELTEEQRAELDNLIKEIRENREKIAGYNEKIEKLDAKQTIINETRKEKSSMTAGELIERAIKINRFIG